MKSCNFLLSLFLVCGLAGNISAMFDYNRFHSATLIGPTADDDIRVLKKRENVLAIFVCYNLSKRSIKYIAENYPNLESLYLRACWAVNDDDIDPIAQNCHQLQSLDFAWCYNITIKSVKVFARQCSDLQFINLENCGRISDEEISDLQKNYLNIKVIR